MTGDIQVESVRAEAVVWGSTAAQRFNRRVSCRQDFGEATRTGKIKLGRSPSWKGTIEISMKEI